MTSPSSFRSGSGDPEKPPKGPQGPAGPKGPSEELDVKVRQKSSTPRLYKVIFHNDDYTTQEFVVTVLIQYFQKSEAEATYIMLKVHRTGSAVAGTYPRDIAESKVQKVTTVAREYGMPLLLTAEPE
jgi:ATP-dependent Clp protease adaptor protein ClpS